MGWTAGLRVLAGLWLGATFLVPPLSVEKIADRLLDGGRW